MLHYQNQIKQSHQQSHRQSRLVAA
jgi:hypothetical protein